MLVIALMAQITQVILLSRRQMTSTDSASWQLLGGLEATRSELHATHTALLRSLTGVSNPARWQERFETGCARLTSEKENRVSLAGGGAALEQYARNGREARAAFGRGGRAAVRALFSSTSPDTAQAAFLRLDSLLSKEISRRQTDFDGAAASSLRALRQQELSLPLGLFVVGLLAFLGLRPRLREYEI